MNAVRKLVQIGMALTLALVVAGASLTGTASAAGVVKDTRANVAVVLQPSAETSSSISYTLTAINDGANGLEGMQVSLPLDPAKLQLDNVQFSRSGGWLETNSPAVVGLETGRLGSGGDKITATIKLTKLVADASLTDRATFSWVDVGGTSGNGRSNLPLRSTAATYPLSVAAATAMSDGDYTLSTSIFAPNEPVTFWYNTPSGQVVAAQVRNGQLVNADKSFNKNKSQASQKRSDYALADDDGAISLDLPTSSFATGNYSLVAQGQWSGFTAVGSFTVK